MVDIAALGLSVDSTGVKQASQDLKGLSAAAGQAQAATSTMAQKSGQDLDALRAKFNPLFAAQRQLTASVNEINAANKAGALSENERAAAILRAEAAYRLQVKAIEQSNVAIQAAARGAALTGFQMSNLAFQLNDVATMAAMGADPLRILASQGGQFFQILQSGEGGVRGTLQFLLERFTALLTPMRLLTGAAVAFGAAALTAANSWVNAQQQIQLALVGTGSAAGVTVDGIDRISTEAAEMGVTTVASARDIALALASTGRVSEENIGRAIVVARDLAKVYGETAAEAAARLAKALADPSRGVDDLNKRLGAFNDATVQLVKNLDEQGRKTEAQRILLEGATRAMVGVTAATTGWARAWLEVSNKASDAWDTIGRGAASFLGFATIEENIRALNEQIERMKESGPIGQWFFGKTIENDIKELERLRGVLRDINDAKLQARVSQDTNDLLGLVDRYAGEDAQRQKIFNDVEKLQKLAADPSVVNNLSAAHRSMLQGAITAAVAQYQGFRTQLDQAIEQYRLDIEALTARTARQRGDLAFKQTLLQLGQPLAEGADVDPRARMQAQLASARAIAEFNYQVTETQKAQTLAAQQRVQTAQMELSLVGQSAAAQERARAVLEQRQQVEAEALRMYGDRNAFDQKHLDALTSEAVKVAEINALLRQRQLAQDLQFERDQIARTDSEREVYSRLRSAGMLTNGEIESTAAQALAAQIRLNNVLQRNMEASREFASGFVKDMVAGKSAAEALSNALNRLADRLMDIALDNAFQSIFGGRGGVNSALSGLFGAKPVSAQSGWDTVVVPAMHSGGLVGRDRSGSRAVAASLFAGAKRYHAGGVIGADEVPIIAQRGETVLPAGMAAGVTVSMPININAQGAYPESIEQIKSAVSELNRTLPGRVVATVRQARDRGIA